MDEFLAEMVKRGKVLGYDSRTLDFVVGYMHDANRTLFLRSNRQADPAKLIQEANCIFTDNSLVQLIFWRDDFGGALARADRARSGKIEFAGKEYFLPDDS